MQFPNQINIRYGSVAIIMMSLLSFNICFAQKAKTLAYKWKIEKSEDAQSSATAQMSTTLMLMNQTGKSIKENNWGIYFNAIKAPKLEATKNAMYEIRHINGDLHYLYPNKNFVPLLPGKTQAIKIIIPDIRNYTELPSGFYLVWNEHPEKAILLTNLSKKADTTERAIAQTSFLKNSKIHDIDDDKLIKIFPTPVKYKEAKGYFEINGQTKIITDNAFAAEASLLQQDLQHLLSSPVVVNKEHLTFNETDLGQRQNRESYKNTIILKKDPTLGNAYTMDISDHHILISSAGPAGLFYGIQSLKTLIPPSAYSSKHGKIAVQALNVLDSARFKHRALLMDVARNFLPKKEVIKTLDVMALYKLNVLHLHLNDDEGWRIEIPDLPELTDIGAKRGYSSNGKGMLPPSYGSGPDVNNTSGTGFYSVKDFKDILIYAAARHIKVIPEIETPGHARAAIKSMDARYEKYIALGNMDKAREYLLRDLDDQSIYHSVQGWNDNVINVAMPSAYRFLEKVTSELVKMYRQVNAPLETIHMGGDEVPAGVWTNSPIIKKLQAANASLKNTDDLWRYYFKKTNAILTAQQLHLYGWEEVDLKHINVAGKRKLVPDSLLRGLNYQVDVWNNIIGTGSEDLAYRLANNGFKVILSNVTNMYLDMAYNKSFYEHGMNWAGFVDTDKPFSFIPYDYYKSVTENEYGAPVAQEFFKNKDTLAAASKQNIAGLQVALWSETIKDTLTYEYMLLPKLLGFAERSWAKDPEWASVQSETLSSAPYQEAWSAFVNVIGKRELPRLDYYHNGFYYRVPEPGILENKGRVEANVQFPGMMIKYTTDGTIPTMNSKLYIEPIKAKGMLSFKVFTTTGHAGKTVVIQ